MTWTRGKRARSVLNLAPAGSPEIAVTSAMPQASPLDWWML